jgi:hypothetical protein
MNDQFLSFLFLQYAQYALVEQFQIKHHCSLVNSESIFCEKKIKYTY